MCLILYDVRMYYITFSLMISPIKMRICSSAKLPLEIEQIGNDNDGDEEEGEEKWKDANLEMVQYLIEWGNINNNVIE